jgi:hypothetical protein
MVEKKSTLTEVQKVIPFFRYDDARDDPNIGKYFVHTRYYLELPIDGSLIIVGRYGSGKTAFLNQIVNERLEEKNNLFVIPISLKADMFIEELREVKKSQDYATFCRALIYLHLLYAIAEESTGSLTTGDKDKLIKELKSLKLQPYGDIISQLAGAVWRTLRRVKKLSIKDLFGIELQPDQKFEVSMRRYRELCLKIEPVVKRLIEEKNVLIVVDALEATAPLAEETANLTGSLIGWLLLEQQKTSGSVQSLVGLPSNLLQYYRNLGGHFPAQDAFVRIEWDEDELEKLIKNRVEEALGKQIGAKKWLKDNLGVDLSETHSYTFGRPRDYIKMIRKCLSIRYVHPRISANECWESGLQHYAEENLEWLQGEWQLALEGFEELIALLQALPNTFPEKDLHKGIYEIRSSGKGKLETRATNSIIADLRRWKLISDVSVQRGGKKLASHPIVRAETYFA